MTQLTEDLIENFVSVWANNSTSVFHSVLGSAREEAGAKGEEENEEKEEEEGAE